LNRASTIVRKKNITLIAIILFNFLAPSFTKAELLISEQEAKLSPVLNQNLTRGISRGPAVIILSPNLSQGHVKSPFDLKIQFEERGGNKIDAAQVKVTYLKSPPQQLLAQDPFLQQLFRYF
jgi:hypothetical protein